MFNSLFINASILICFLYVGSLVFVNQRIDCKSSLRTKISIGVLFGLTGCMLMFNGIDLSNHMIMDFRIVALIISAIFCGPLSAFITGVLLILFRFGYYGVNAASYIALFNLTVITVLCSILSLTSLNFKRKFLFMSLVNFLSSAVWTYVLVKDTRFMVKILLDYIFATTAVSIIVYFTLIHIYRTNELYQELKRESTKDFLTGLNNVRGFDKLLNDAVNNADKKQENLSLLMVDIDFFKKVNDTYGHPSGDKVLKQLGEILTGTCRSFDIISRNGGEEFTALLMGCSHNQALEIAESIRHNVERYIFVVDNGVKINITVSIGVSSYPDVTDDPNNLFHEADNALYLAKREGRNRVK